MNARGLLALGLLVVATAMERFAYYGSRSFLVIDLRAEGSDVASIGTLFVALQGLTVVGMIAGAATAFAIGPRATVAAAALVAALGSFAVAAGAPILGVSVGNPAGHASLTSTHVGTLATQISP